MLKRSVMFALTFSSLNIEKSYCWNITCLICCCISFLWFMLILLYLTKINLSDYFPSIFTTNFILYKEENIFPRWYICNLEYLALNYFSPRMAFSSNPRFVTILFYETNVISQFEENVITFNFLVNVLY